MPRLTPISEPSRLPKLNAKSAALFSVLFSFFYVYIIPWDQFHFFPDIQNYLARAALLLDPNHVEVTWSKRSSLTQELLWKKYLSAIAPFLNHHPWTIRLSSLAGLIIFTRLIVRKSNIAFLLLLFFNPIFIDLILSQLRTAIAFPLVMLTFYVKPIWLKLILALLAVSLHTASIIIIIIYITLGFISRSVPRRFRGITAVALAASSAVALEQFLEPTLEALGDSRLSGALANSSSSILFASFWLALALLIVASHMGPSKKQPTTLDLLTITMGSLFFFCSMLGVYGVRFVALCIPLLCVSIARMTQWQRILLFPVIVVWQASQYYYWL